MPRHKVMTNTLGTTQGAKLPYTRKPRLAHHTFKTRSNRFTKLLREKQDLFVFIGIYILIHIYQIDGPSLYLDSNFSRLGGLGSWYINLGDFT